MMKNSQGRATLASTGLGLLLVPTICLAEDGPLAVTRLETTVIGIGEGVTLDEIFSVPGTPAADLEECLSVDFSTSQGASNLGACFSVNAGTTFQADIAYTPADPTEDAGIIGSAYLILSILEETDVVIDGMGSEGLAWTIRGPLDLDIDASSQETVLLPAGEYVLQSRMSWGSLIPNQLLITSLTEDALRLNEISAYGEVVYSGAVAESSTLSDLEGIPIEMNVTSSGEVPDCADSNELESTISFTVTPGFGIPGPGLLASGIADESNQCSNASATFEADFTLNTPCLAIWKTSSIYYRDVPVLDGLCCQGWGCRELAAGDWSLIDGGIYDGSAVSIAVGFIPSRIMVPEEASTINDAIALARTRALELPEIDELCDESELPTFTIEIAEGTYQETVSSIGPGVALNLIARDGDGTVTIDGDGTGPCLELLEGYPVISIEGIHFINGFGTTGGGVVIGTNTEASFRACTFLENTAETGGALWLDGAAGTSVLVEDCTFEENLAAVEGGAILHAAPGESTLEISGSTFCLNHPGDIAGEWTDLGDNLICANCPSDINRDGVTDGADLSLLLGRWGPCPDDASCAEDLDGDGMVDGADLAVMLGAWGLCP